MLRIKFITAVVAVFLTLYPGLLHSQTKPFILFNVLPGSDRTVLIHWRMVPEMDTLAFEVERSRDKVIWEKVSSVTADSSHKYTSIDRRPGEGLIYYRIKQVDTKGRHAYTGVNWVQFSETGKLFIWPNPANDMLHIKTPYATGRIDILNSGGKHLLKVTIINFITDIPTLHLPAGLYVLQVRHGNETLVERFVKE